MLTIGPFDLDVMSCEFSPATPFSNRLFPAYFGFALYLIFLVSFSHQTNSTYYCTSSLYHPRTSSGTTLHPVPSPRHKLLSTFMLLLFLSFKAVLVLRWVGIFGIDLHTVYFVLGLYLTNKSGAHWAFCWRLGRKRERGGGHHCILYILYSSYYNYNIEETCTLLQPRCA